MTLNQIIAALRKIGISHAQINSVVYGYPADFLTDKDVVYPALFIGVPTPSIRSKKISFAFQFFLMDRVISEFTNLTEVQSDQLLIAQDLLSLFTDAEQIDPSYTWDNPTDAQFTLFSDSTPDSLGGCRMDLALSSAFVFDSCQVPTRVIGNNYITTESGITLFTEDGMALTTETNT